MKVEEYIKEDGSNPFGSGTKKIQQSDINEAKKLFKAYKQRKQKKR